jgi:6-phosphogluconolactonase
MRPIARAQLSGPTIQRPPPPLRPRSSMIQSVAAHIVPAPAAAGGRRQLVFVGCYTDSTPFLFGSTGGGVLSFELEPSTGALTPLNGGKPTPAGTNPTYLTASADGSRLYCGNETEPSEVRSFVIDATSDAPLTPLNSQPAHGLGACWVTLDHEGKHLLAANYTSGSCCVFPIDAQTGGLLPASDVQEQGGTLGPNSNRQEGPHAHCVFFSPTSATDCYVPDLGMDMVHHFKYSSADGKLALSSATSVSAAAPGVGPRHFCFHPSGKFACECACSLLSRAPCAAALCSCGCNASSCQQTS